MKRVLLFTAVLILLLGSYLYSEDNFKKDKTFKITINVNGKILIATLLDNATSRNFIEKLPLTLHMEDLYKREMCYHFSTPLLTDKVEFTGYEVGEIIY